MPIAIGPFPDQYADLRDVNTASLADQDIFKWDVGSGKFVHSTFVSSFNTRTGVVSLTSGDVTTALGFTPVSGSGSTGTLPKWSNTSGGLANSLVSESGSVITAGGDFTVSGNASLGGTALVSTRSLNLVRSGTGDWTGLSFTLTRTDSGSSLTGLNFVGSANHTSGTLSQIQGGILTARLINTGTLSFAQGIQGSASCSAAGAGVLTLGEGIRGAVGVITSGNITTGIGVLGLFLNTGGAVGELNIIQSRSQYIGGTVTSLRGLYVGGWTGDPPATNLDGILIDSTIDAASATTKFAFRSLSVSPSLITGNLTISGVLKTGSGPVTITDSAGNLTSAAIVAGLGFTPRDAAAATVNTFNTRSGTVTLTSGDVTTALGFTPVPIGGSTTQVLRNNAGAIGGISGATSDGTKIVFSTGSIQITDLLDSSGSFTIFSSVVANTNLFAGALGGNLTGTGTSNTAYGQLALQNFTSASFNVAVGAGALRQGTTGGTNTGIGYFALSNNTTGTFNVAVGTNAGIGGVGATGGQNISIGGGANSTTAPLGRITSGNDNIAIGTAALASVLTGNQNVSIGTESGNVATGSGNVFLGYKAGNQETGSNRLYIANSNTTTPLIGGDFNAATVTITGALGAASFNGMTLTTSSGTFTLANSKVFTVSNTLTLTATDGSTLAIGGGGTLGSAAYTSSGAYQPIDATLTALAAYNTNGLLTQTAADTFTGRTITGTANRLTVTNGDGVSGNPILDISSSYVGQATITTLGTIATGVWNGTIITSAFGGTGNGFTKFFGPTTTEKTFTLPNASATILTDNAAVSVAQGGTGVATFAANGVLYGNAATSVLVTAQGAANSVLTANAGAPSFSQAPIINTSIQIGVVSSVTGSLKLAHASSANLTTITAGNAAAARTYVWPTNFGAAGSQLTDAAGDGTLSWAAAGSGASLALDNLVSVSINTSLLAQTGVDLGSTTKPFRDCYLFGAGTFATTYLKLTGTPTGTRTVTFIDATHTVARQDAAQTFTGVQTMTSPVITTPWITTGIQDSSGNSEIALTATASAVYGLTLANAALLGTVSLGVTVPTQASASVAGTPLSITAQAAVAGSSSAGAAAGGAITITSGAAARLTSGNANGGAITISPGTGIGTGTFGAINLAGINSGTGLSVQSNAAAAGVTLTPLSSGTDEGFIVNPKGNPSYAMTFSLAAGANLRFDTIMLGTRNVGAGNTLGLSLSNATGVGWSSGSAWSSSASVLAIWRNANAVLEINNGTAGQWGSLLCGVRDAGTTTVVNGLTLGHQSSGTPAAGLGIAVLLNLNSSTTADQNAAQIAATWTTATHASRTADFVLSLVNNAAALAEVFRVKGNGLIIQPQTVTAGGTTTTQTIDKPMGQINIAAGASTVTVNNALATTTSLIIPVILTADVTAQIKNVVRSAGSFVINLVANATAETVIGWWLVSA